MLAGALKTLLEWVRLITSAGPSTAGALFVAGLILFVVGHRTFRIAAALIAAVIAATAVGYWRVHIASTPAMAQAIGGLVGACCGLIWPEMLIIVSLGVLGFMLSSVLYRHGPPEMILVVRTVSIGAGVIFPAMFYDWLPALAVPPVAAILMTFGAWGLFGINYPNALAYRVPAVWLGVAGLITLCGWAIEQARVTRSKQAEVLKKSGTPARKPG